MKKKGLVVVYDPHNLYQFLWYYSSYGLDKEWTALCLPNGNKGEYMSSFCQKSGVFEIVISSKDSFLEKSMLKKLGVFLKMFFSYIVGKRTQLCKRLICNYVDIEDYSTLCVMTDVGIVSGMVVALGKEKEVVIFEDGIGDYAFRDNKFHFRYLKNPFDFMGFCLAKMGYSNPGHYFELETTSFCTKYSSHPEKMFYQKYKEHKQLYNYEKTDLAILNKICDCTYSEYNPDEIDKYDAIVFTEAFNVYNADVEWIKNKVYDFLNSRYSNVLFKKHPLDTADYKIEKSFNVEVMSSEVPGEVIIPHLKGKDIYFMGMSSLLMYMTQYKENISFFYFKTVYENNKSDGYLNYFSKEYMTEYIKNFEYDSNQMIFL